MGLTVLGLILIYGTVDLTAIAQQQSGVLLGFLPAWGIFYQPFAAILFLTAAIAENKRIPFDLPEAESELIAGYFTEYSAMKMGLVHVRRSSSRSRSSARCSRRSSSAATTSRS